MINFIDNLITKLQHYMDSMVSVTFMELSGNHIEKTFTTNNYAEAFFYCLLKCPKFLDKLILLDKKFCKIYYQQDSSDTFGEGFYRITNEGIYRNDK